VKANATEVSALPPEPGSPVRLAGAAEAVTALYEEHALGLVRLAVVMLGDRPAAEDVVQEAFCGLYRRWHGLSDPAKALAYVRSSVINGCRSALRRRVRQPSLADFGGFDSPGGSGGSAGSGGFGGFGGADQPGESDSAESEVMLGEEHRQVLLAIRRLPARQREALVLRYYLDLDEGEIATSMRVSRGTVKSTTSRALAALGRILEEQS
jgi:RNA polymerase sigma factor (sigma-70 family)